MDTLFSHVNVVTMNEQMTLWQDAFVGVTDGKIAYMAKKPPEEKPKKIIDATGMVLMPGLINCHTHLPMYLLRGYADDLNLQDWLQHYIFPREDRLDGRAVKAATTLALAEALRFGTTSVSDMYYFCDEICQAVAESGIKANISRGTSMFLGDDFCFDTFPACQELVALKDKWHNYDNGRIKIEASIHAEYTSTYQLWDALAEYAVNNGLQLQDIRKGNLCMSAFFVCCFYRCLKVTNIIQTVKNTDNINSVGDRFLNKILYYIIGIMIIS